jgi:hypothetical protein
LYMADIHRYYNRKYTDFTLLSSFDGKLWLKKNSDSSISIKTEKAGILTGMFQRLVRTNPTVVPGRVYKLKNFDAAIVKTTDDMLDALEVKFDFRYSLGDPGTLFLFYDGDKMGVWNFNSQPYNEWLFIGDASDVMKSMM